MEVLQLQQQHRPPVIGLSQLDRLLRRRLVLLHRQAENGCRFTSSGHGYKLSISDLGDIDAP